MKRQLLFFIIAILGINSNSQISFEKGYFINDSGQKIDCLIKNIDWKNNPTEFEYKLSDHSDKKIATIKTVKEFGVSDISKYRRFTVKIDRSKKDISKMSNQRQPIFKEETLFLKVLIEGKANLYSFEDGNLKRYFYNKDHAEIEQLVFKHYLTTSNKIAENSRYKQQLRNHLKCSNSSIGNVENVDYKQKELVNYFTKYNACNDQKFVNFEEKRNKDLVNLNIRPGLNVSTLSLDRTLSDFRDIDFDGELAFRLGVEVELIMPFNKNKWAVILEPTYQYFKSEKMIRTQNVVADYKSIELPIGIRHYFFLNEDSKLFANGSFVLDFASNSAVEYEFGTNLDINTRTNVAFGVGYKHKDKYSVELRYQTARELLSSHLFWISDYNTVSVIFGYSLF